MSQDRQQFFTDKLGRNDCLMNSVLDMHDMNIDKFMRPHNVVGGGILFITCTHDTFINMLLIAFLFAQSLKIILFMLNRWVGGGEQ